MSTRTCYYCLYGGQPSALRIYTSMMACWPSPMTCVNHPAGPGCCCDVAPTATCRNFRPRREPSVRIEPPDPPDETLRHIALTKGRHAIVDAADYDWLRRFRWHAKETRGRFYAATVLDGRSVPMHRLIMDSPRGTVVDHIDGNGLNNTRANLRVCTPQQNRRNTRPVGKAPYVGVHPVGKRWKAKIKHNGRNIFLGYFDDPTDAARARDAAAREYHGQFAWLNFPEDRP